MNNHSYCAGVYHKISDIVQTLISPLAFLFFCLIILLMLRHCIGLQHYKTPLSTAQIPVKKNTYKGLDIPLTGSIIAHSSQLTAHSSQLTAHSSQLTALRPYTLLTASLFFQHKQYCFFSSLNMKRNYSIRFFILLDSIFLRCKQKLDRIRSSKTIVKYTCIRHLSTPTKFWNAFDSIYN